MMKLRALVAKCDGQGGSPDRPPFASGAVWPPSAPLFVTREFDPRLAPIGTAMLRLEGDDLFAEMEIRDGVSVAGLFPCLGGRTIEFIRDKKGASAITRFEAMEVSLCVLPNLDARIPAVGFSNFFNATDVKRLFEMKETPSKADLDGYAKWLRAELQAVASSLGVSYEDLVADPVDAPKDVDRG